MRTHSSLSPPAEMVSTRCWSRLAVLSVLALFPLGRSLKHNGGAAPAGFYRFVRHPLCLAEDLLLLARSCSSRRFCTVVLLACGRPPGRAHTQRGAMLTGGSPNMSTADEAARFMLGIY
jgi:hypothetical protein